MILGGAIYLLWRWTMARYNRVKDVFKQTGWREPAKTAEGQMSELVQDPVCKLYIAKETAISYKGQHFCSEKCRGEYKEEV